MPKDLPGLYWDEDKKRYFPLSSKPAGGPPPKPKPEPGAPSASAEPSSHQERPGRHKQRTQRRRGSDSDDNPPLKRHNAATASPHRNTWAALSSFRESVLGLQQGRRCMQYVRVRGGGLGRRFALIHIRRMDPCSQVQIQHLSTCALDRTSVPIRLDGFVSALCATVGPESPTPNAER